MQDPEVPKDKAKKLLRTNPCAYKGKCQGFSGCTRTVLPPPSPPTPPSQLVVAYQCTDANGRIVPDPAGSQFAQTFKAAAGGQLERAEVELLNNVADADLEFELRSVDASGQPDAVLATSTVTDVPATILSTDPPRTVTALFNVGTLVAGEEYALTVRKVNAGAVSFHFRIGGECGGRLYTASPQTPFRFEFLRDADLALAVFVRT